MKIFRIANAHTHKRRIANSAGQKVRGVQPHLQI